MMQTKLVCRACPKAEDTNFELKSIQRRLQDYAGGAVSSLSTISSEDKIAAQKHKVVKSFAMFCDKL